jgi:hypothetical protein
MTDTTTQWRGLHNPERHFSAFGTGTPLCEECGDALCVPSNPCYCCLEAEVEALRAQVQRVRELRDRFRDHEKWASYRNVETLLTRALDGDA